MRLWIRMALALMVLLYAVPALAGTLVSHPKGSSGSVIVWASKDAYLGCRAEVKETGDVGRICSSGAVAMVPVGTKARRIKGWIFLKIQVLNGDAAGVVGFVPTEYYAP